MIAAHSPLVQPLSDILSAKIFKRKRIFFINFCCAKNVLRRNRPPDNLRYYVEEESHWHQGRSAQTGGAGKGAWGHSPQDFFLGDAL